METALREELSSRLRQAGAYETRVADPAAGFGYAVEGFRPLELWPSCRSVIVFAVAHSSRTNNIFAGPLAPFDGDREIGPVPSFIRDEGHALDRLSRLFVSSIRLKAMTFLSERGYGVSFRYPQLKLAGFEAGLGVYGKSGLLIHPVLGSRMSLGSILTDAALEPDGRLEGFNPCRSCDLCLKACPAGAFDAANEYPDSWSMEKCLAKRSVIEARGLYCNNCFAACPACRIPEDDLLAFRCADSVMERQRFILTLNAGGT